MASSNAEAYGPLYWSGGAGSNYGEYGDDPGWNETAEVLRPYLRKDALIIEAGCAYGYFVAAARRAGWAAYGYDPSRYAISQAPTEVKAFVSSGDFTTHRNDAGDAIFDMGCSWEMLEHLDGPSVWEGLVNMRSQIVPGGLMIHRIAMADQPDVPPHDAHSDPTHINLQTRAYWHEVFSDLGMKHRADIEEALDAKFHYRDWRRRFFAYEV